MTHGLLSPSEKRRNLTRRDAGFTLVEMLVVLGIVGMLVSVVGPRVLGYFSDSKVKAARIQIDSLAAAMDLFFLDAGRYPTGAEGLNALMARPGSASAWNGPYLKGSALPKDPWGNAYVYRIPGQHGPYDIYSLGPDGREGSTIVASWNR